MWKYFNVPYLFLHVPRQLQKNTRDEYMEFEIKTYAHKKEMLEQPINKYHCMQLSVFHCCFTGAIVSYC